MTAIQVFSSSPEVGSSEQIILCWNLLLLLLYPRLGCTTVIQKRPPTGTGICECYMRCSGCQFYISRDLHALKHEESVSSWCFWHCYSTTVFLCSTACAQGVQPAGSVDGDGGRSAAAVSAALGLLPQQHGAPSERVRRLCRALHGAVHPRPGEVPNAISPIKCQQNHVQE